MKIKIKIPTDKLFNKALLKCEEMNIIPRVKLDITKYLLIDNDSKDVSVCNSANTFDKFQGLEFDIDKFFNLNLK